MKVVVFTTQFPYLSETFIVDQIIGMINRGHGMRILSTSHPEPDAAQPEVCAYHLLPKTRYLTVKMSSRARDLMASAMAFFKLSVAVPTKAFRIFVHCWPFTSSRRVFLRLLAELQAAEIDVLHCHYGPNGEFAVRAREILGKNFAVVTSFHGWDMGVTDVANHYQRLFQCGDAFIANTAFTQRRLAEMGCPPLKISVMPVGVDLDSIEARPHPCREPGSPIRLVTVARLVEFKGLDVAVRAVALLKERGLLVRYRIVGGGHLKSELETLVQRLSLQQEVTLTGPLQRPDVLREMAASDMFVLPSIEYGGRTETQGLVVQEAQAAGLPVIASNVGGIPDGVCDGETGLLFPPGDSSALAACVERLANDFGLQAKICRGAREWVESRYNSRAIAAQLEAIYQNAVSVRIAVSQIPTSSSMTDVSQRRRH